MKKAVFALAADRAHAEHIVKSLQDAGFNTEEVSFLLADQDGRVVKTTESGGTRTAEVSPSTRKSGALRTEKSTKAPEGGVTGAAAGGIIGGTLGLLAGIGTIAIPGLGVFIAAGPILAALSGSAIGGSLGLLIGVLVGLDIPEYEAKKYESGLKKGNVLIAVEARNADFEEKAKKILARENAKDIASTREKAGSKR